MCFECGGGFFVAMSGEVIQDNGGARRDLRDQDLSDIGRKGGAIHRTLDDPGCNQGITHQPCDQRLCAPTSKRRIHRQAFATRGPAAQASEVRLDRCFIQKNNTFRHPRNGWQAVREPISAPLPHIGATAFGGDQRLFYA